MQLLGEHLDAGLQAHEFLTQFIEAKRSGYHWNRTDVIKSYATIETLDHTVLIKDI